MSSMHHEHKLSKAKQCRVRQQFDTLDQRGNRYLQERWKNKALIEATEATLKYLPFTPAILIVGLIIAKLFDLPTAPIWYLLFFLLPGVFFALCALKKIGAYRSNRANNLAQFDIALHNQDRFQAADEFLQIEKIKPFHWAAIKDALTKLSKAEAIYLAPPPKRKIRLRPYWPQLLGTLLLTAIPLWLPHTVSTYSDEKNSNITAVGSTGAKQKQDTEKAASIKTVVAQHKTDETKTSTVANQQNKAKKAAPASSKQALSPPPGSSANKNKNLASAIKNSAHNADTKQSATGDKPKSEASLASEGLDTSNNRNNSPLRSGMPLMNRKADQDTSDDESLSAMNNLAGNMPEEQEEPPEDSHSAAAAKKLEQKGAASRLLSISPQSGQINPFATDRGGASGLKKSRGVAAMMLGVPEPDRFIGTPNAGRVKTTQQSDKPETQETTVFNHEPRGERQGDVAAVPSAESPPWLKQLVTRYFLEQREPSPK